MKAEDYIKIATVGGSDQAQYVSVDDAMKAVQMVREESADINSIIKQWNKFAKPSRRLPVDFGDKYEGITYDKCLQILKLLNVKRK